MFDMAKALEEIEQRSRLRTELGLPPLSATHELRKLKLYYAEREAVFEEFFRTLQRVEEKLLARQRRLRQDP
jgi:hypothetical protein